MGKDLKGRELGSGIHQRKSGSYTARFTDRFGNRRSIYSSDLEELRKKFVEEQYKNEIGINVYSDKVTISEWFTEWMDTYKKNIVRESTFVTYTQYFRSYIEPVLGKRKLDSVRSAEITKLLKSMKDGGFSYDTRNGVRIILQDMYNKAILNELAHRNPVAGVRVHRDERREVRYLSKVEQKEFFKCSNGTFYHNLFIVAVSTGMRIGEIAALTENDLDFGSRIIHVTKNLLYTKFEGDVKKTYKFGPPKTATSIRDVPMTDECMAALKDQIRLKRIVANRISARIPKGFEDLLFVTSVNTPLNDQDVTQAIRAVLRQINLTLDDCEQIESFSFHCFRHTFATRCFEVGMAPKVIQGLLGHAHQSMTMDLYTHLTDEKKEEELKKLPGVYDS